MGIRITAFAVDCAGFRDWLTRPVGDVLFYIAEHGVGEPRPFHVWDANEKIRYLSVPQKGVFRSALGDHTNSEWIAQSTVFETPSLIVPLGEYLARSNGYTMKFLFDSLATCAEVKWVRVLSDGYRPGWIFSLLRGARDVGLPSVDLEELQRLCARMLRGYNYKPPDYTLVPHEAPPETGSLPVLPKEDADCRICVWDQAECRRWLELSQATCGRVGVFPDFEGGLATPNAEMDRLVRELVQSFGPLRNMLEADVRMVSFID